LAVVIGPPPWTRTGRAECDGLRRRFRQTSAVRPMMSASVATPPMTTPAMPPAPRLSLCAELLCEDAVLFAGRLMIAEDTALVDTVVELEVLLEVVVIGGRSVELARNKRIGDLLEEWQSIRYEVEVAVLRTS
jgi:hypothetical protein